ncbi:MAG: radical SAM protein [Ignavibacteria bacterium]|nr:radical SAM protein [Ignavibacteria bacterium]
MELSKHNIVSKIEGTEDYYIVNLLSGNADILSAQKAEEIFSGNFSDIDEYIEKGYIVEQAAEKKIYNEKYLDFIESRDTDEVQIFFVPWYACNFDCSYCYQSGYHNKFTVPSTELIDSFFAYVLKKFAHRKKYITIFGGEPLLPGETYRNTITYILSRAKEANLEVAIVTNGFLLSEYIDILKDNPIREVQVTLDGVNATHDSRRYLQGGGQTFESICKGIDQALTSNVTINLRMVVDKENIKALVDLANYAINKGWTKSPFFKTQLGRNYELHYCQTGNERLFSRLEFYTALFHEVNEHPEILEFHKPAFSISKFLFENGELPSPLFDSCTGCKTEWAFDYTGNIYACTATVGKPGEALGTFYPEVTLNDDMVMDWEDRDVTAIAACKECSLQLACGGGCAAVAQNRNGSIQSPDCRPVKELIGMGIKLYSTHEE